MVDPALYSLRCGPSSLAPAVGHLRDSGRQHGNRLGSQSRCLSADGRPNSGPRLPASGIWTTAERELHITHLELRAVKEMILAFKSRLRGKSLLLWEDNQGVVGILKKLCTKSQAMMADLHDIMVLLEELDMIL